ncbi:MAG: TetR/AcrR family transcriptional regulator [Methanomassiliicoccus sp.]|nr:TetR/AcrR family transcriptional regulator [Methanomassiliicoccus sp.]
MPRVYPNYKNEARNSIMHAAMDLFRERGYHATTMEQIADRLGVSKATLYTYYKSKEDLLVTAIKDAPSTIMSVMRESLSRSDILDQSGSFFDGMMDIVRSYSPGLFFEVMSEASRNEVIRDAVNEDAESTVTVIVDLLEEQRENGRLRPDLDLEALARGMSSLYYGLIASLILDSDEKKARKAWTASIECMVAGAVTPGPHPVR